MKKVLIIVTGMMMLAACTNGDNVAANGMTEQQKNAVTHDSANFTTIQWIDSTFKDLGQVNEGQQVEVSYKFKNSGNKNLIITDIKAECGCTIPEKPEKPIAPGEEGTIRAKFNSKNKEGMFRKGITVSANTQPSTVNELKFQVEVKK